MKSHHLIFVLFCSLLFVSSQCVAAIKGVLDFVTLQSNGTVRLHGWACDTGVQSSISIHIYFNGAAGTGQLYRAANANLSSETAVSSACNTAGIPHRFTVEMPSADVAIHQGKTVYVHGISVNHPNLLINNSGSFTVPAAPAPIFLAAPANLTAITSGTSVSISWDPIVNGSTYFIKQNLNGVWQAEINKGTARSHSFTVSANNIYGYQVRGCNASSQCSDWSYVLTINTSPAVTYIHTDILGSVIGESNQSGVMLKKTEHKPYGERKEQ
ncbi:fibronectin type III domain-containing protein [Alishewanella jeotgali]|uniref:fibronectin type III domain-containing protein n=1 Tax=Alishewanella jeotgali TaxID=545533 RepID=UPI0002E855F6|nr:fibronectin type III domain-containing protein [Alishewanella jeotgali]